MYQLDSDYARDCGVYGKYLHFVKVGQATWHPGHIVPVVYFYKVVSDCSLSLGELEDIEYLPQFFTPNVYKKNPQKKKLYLLELLSTSAKVIPSNKLHFVGNLQHVRRIAGEDTSPYSVSWKDLDRYIISNFEDWMSET